jgi:hypothetical protein
MQSEWVDLFLWGQGVLRGRRVRRVRDRGKLATCRENPTGRDCTGQVDYPPEKRDFCV